MRVITQGNRTDRTDFDAMLRPVLQGKSETGSGELYVTIDTSYDWKGQKTFESYPVDGMAAHGTVAAGVTSTYDPIGRVTSTTQPSEFPDHPTLTTYTDYLAGGVRKVTDPNLNSVSTAYQGFDEPDSEHAVKVDAIDATGHLLSSQTIARNVLGEVLSVSQGGVTRFTHYDDQHRVCRTDEPESGSEMTAYDAAGNPVWTAAGQPSDPVDRCDYDQVADADKVSRSYDGMNRLASQAYPAGSLALTFGYDLLGKPASAVSDTGAGTVNNKGVVTWTFGRNKLGLLTSEIMAVDSYAWTLGYGYDGNGVLSSVQYPDGEAVNFAPNALGQPTAAGRYLSGATYWPDGQEKDYLLGNGALFSAGRNARQLLNSLSYATAANDAVHEALTYDYNGNISEIADQMQGGQRTRSMTYDGLNRLLSATAPSLWGTETYTYDAKNDITSIANGTATNTYTYNAQNQLASITGATTRGFTYDARGNAVNRDGQAMVFDLANRLMSVQNKGEYMYDAAGRRVKSTTPTAKTYYAYNADGTLMWEYDPASGEGTNYIHLGKKLVASKKALIAPSVAPTLTARATAQENVTYAVSWTAVPAAATYDLQEEPEGGSWATIYSGANLAQSVMHSSAGTFHYQARACNATGCGPWSTTAATVITPPPTAPEAPATITAAPAANQQSMTVTWSASATATSYTVQQMIGAGNWTAVYEGPATTATASSPADGSYVFQVQACSTVGCSVWKQSTALVLQHTPAAPGSISVQSPSSGSIAISWPAVTYGKSYVVGRSTDGTNFADVYNGAATSTTQSVGASGTYWFRVRACNSTNGTVCGPNSPSGASAVTVPPNQPPGISAPGTSNNGCYTVNWSGVAGATSYVMQEQFNGGGFGTIGNNGSGALAICGKGAGTYGYRVQGCNSGGCGPFSGTATVTVSFIPPVPDGVHMEETIVGKSQRYTLSWYATPTATRYEILNINLNKTVYSGTDLSYRVEAGVFPYDLHNSYSVRACNSYGCSGWGYP